MKSWKLVTSVLLVLLGFCAGVGLNFFKIRATVQGASGPPEPPPAALKVVAHDATLTGNGTTTAPLGIANGSGGVRVVDSLGQDVGPFALIGAMRKVGLFTFLLGVTADGFQKNAGSFVFLHTTSDCSGPRYFGEGGTGLLRGSYNHGAELFYPADPIQQISVHSFEQMGSPSDPNQPEPCFPQTPPITVPAGLASTLDLSTLGLTPPFHLEF